VMPEFERPRCRRAPHGTCGDGTASHNRQVSATLRERPAVLSQPSFIRYPPHKETTGPF